MKRVPEYVPAARFGKADRLMLNAKLSTSIPLLLLPKILTTKICRAAPAAPNGPVWLSGESGPPLIRTSTADEGMSGQPTPHAERCASAAVLLLKYAQTERFLFWPGFT